MAKRDRTVNTVLSDEKQAMREAEPALVASPSPQDVDEAVADALEVERGADADAVLPAEAAAVHTDTETAKEASGDTARPATVTRSVKSRTAKQERRRSARYRAAVRGHDVQVPLALADAIAMVQATSYSRFDGTVELHARLTQKKSGAFESVRGLVTLPGGAAKVVMAVVLTEASIDEIARTKQADADVYLAPPTLMPTVARIAKILGPQGKMPSPKTGTVTTDPDTVLAEIRSGRTEYRADSSGIVHVGVGKVSWPIDRIVGNAIAVLTAIGSGRLRSLSIASTMGPGIPVDITRLTE
jgi:large subunit ribosomal protein L1